MNPSDFHWSDMITKVVSALIILVITALIAKLVKKILSRGLLRVTALQRNTDSGDSLAGSLGSIAALIVWLFGLMAILNLFALTQVVAPIQGLLGGVLGALPKILAAGVVLFIGFVFAKIARELVVTALQAANADRLLERFEPSASAAPSAATTESLGAHYESGKGSSVRISATAGQLVFAVILIVVAIAALQVLDIKSVSQPASNMLALMLNALPHIIGAAIVLVLGVMVARFAGRMLETLLRGMRLDAGVERLGVDSNRLDGCAVLARVAQIAIVLFFALAATKLLDFPEITQLLNGILVVAGHVAFGAAVIIAGVFIAKLVASFATGQTATVIRYGTIALFVAIGLRYMGLANSIINLGFGALVVGGAAAAAIAFGLGGRDAAARQLETLQARSKVGARS